MNPHTYKFDKKIKSINPRSIFEKHFFAFKKYKIKMQNAIGNMINLLKIIRKKSKVTVGSFSTWLP
jgi:hypothetical protein